MVRLRLNLLNSAALAPPPWPVVGPLVPVLERAALSRTGILWKAGARGDAVTVTEGSRTEGSGLFGLPAKEKQDDLLGARLVNNVAIDLDPSVDRASFDEILRPHFKAIEVERWVIAEATVARRILHHLGLDSQGPPVARAQAPSEHFDPGPDYDVADPAHYD